MNASQLWNDHTFRVLLEDLFKARKDEALGPMRLDALTRYVEGATRPAESPIPSPQEMAAQRAAFQRKAAYVAKLKSYEDHQATTQRLETMVEGDVPGEAAGFELTEDASEVPPGFIVADGEDVPIARQSFCYKCNAGRKVKKRGKVWRCETCNSSNVNSEPNEGDQNLGRYLDSAPRQNPMDALNKTADLIEKKLKEGLTSFTIPKTYLVQGIEQLLKERRVPISGITCVLMPKQAHLNTSSPSAISGEAGTNTGGWTITVSR